MQSSLKYRPKRFSEVYGQEVSVRILVNSIRMDRVPKALLFSGLRGVGKTTLARLYAKALNCSAFLQANEPCCQCDSCLSAEACSHLSILEMDAASNSGVDNIRDLESILVQVIPHTYRVVILDEVHMLSKSAQAALLKTLEEPPKNTVFILVTTDPQRLEDTIRSRCLSMPLQALSEAEVASSVRLILDSEGKIYTDEFVETLSRLGGGSLRDVQQILDLMILAAGEGSLDVNLLKDSAGIISREEYGNLADVLDQRNLRFFLEEIRRWYAEGRDLKHLFIEGVPTLLRDLGIYLSGVKEGDVKLLSGLPYGSLSCNLTLSLADLKMLSREWEITMEYMRATSLPRVVWGMFAIKVSRSE